MQQGDQVTVYLTRPGNGGVERLRESIPKATVAGEYYDRQLGAVTAKSCDKMPCDQLNLIIMQFVVYLRVSDRKRTGWACQFRTSVRH